MNNSGNRCFCCVLILISRGSVMKNEPLLGKQLADYYPVEDADFLTKLTDFKNGAFTEQRLISKCGLHRKVGAFIELCRNFFLSLLYNVLSHYHLFFMPEINVCLIFYILNLWCLLYLVLKMIGRFRIRKGKEHCNFYFAWTYESGFLGS